MKQSQSHIWLTAFSYMVKYLRISSYIRKPFLIYDFATAPFWISYICGKFEGGRWSYGPWPPVAYHERIIFNRGLSVKNLDLLEVSIATERKIRRTPWRWYLPHRCTQIVQSIPVTHTIPSRKQHPLKRGNPQMTWSVQQDGIPAAPTPFHCTARVLSNSVEE